jgi:hypothetical protein
MTSPLVVTAFAGPKRIGAGPLPDVALRLAKRPAGDDPILVFNDANGAVVDLDLRGSETDIRARLEAGSATNPSRGPGRPRLGVVSREVTLLPHHWEWLGIQRGGASAALRRLVEEARRATASTDRQRVAEERTYRFIAAIAGDYPGFEEAARALFAHDTEGFEARMSEWPEDLRTYALGLLHSD